MRINLNVDELRSIAPLSANAAEKMNESNEIISSIVSTHDWKCPERVTIDESLEKLKNNSVLLNEAFIGFSHDIIDIANGFTDYINADKRFNIEYDDEIASLLSLMYSSNKKTTVSSGSNVAGIVSSIETNSMHSSNIMSLHGSTHDINIVDFSLFT